MIYTYNHLLKRLRHWVKVIGIDKRYRITAKINTDSQLMPKGCEDAQACIEVSQAYFTAHIDFLDNQSRNNEALDKLIIHELLHIITAPMKTIMLSALPDNLSQLAIDAEESTIERLVDVVYRSGKRKTT